MALSRKELGHGDSPTSDVAAGFPLREAMQREAERALVTDPGQVIAKVFSITYTGLIG